MNPIRRFANLVKLIRRAGGVRGAAQLTRDAPKYLALYKRLLADGRVPNSAKVVLVGAGAFAVSPLNLPQYIPVVGALDDLGIMLLANSYFMKQVPAGVMAEHRAGVGLAV